MKTTNLKADGERFLPEFSGMIELEHYHRYFIAMDLVKDKIVLDIASGEGFGSEILSRQARNVIGVDVSKDAVDHANEKYARDTLKYICGSATSIPLEDSSVDVVVSFETIEHLTDHASMMDEIRRVLMPGGLLIMSSPNKFVYSDVPKYKNPFHLRELYTSDFITLVTRYFKNARHLGQRVVAASIIAGGAQESGFKTYTPAGSSNGVNAQMYDVILASDGTLPDVANSLYEDPDGILQPQKIEAALAAHKRLSAELEQVRKDLEQARAEIEQLQTREREFDIDVAAEKADLQSRLEKLSRKHADAIERLRVQQAALDTIVEDANRIVEDKWWRRTRALRRWSNSIRKLKGKPKKKWQTKFDINHYIGGPASGHSSVPVTSLAIDPNIPVVEYSTVNEGYVIYHEQPKLETIPKLIAFYLPQFHPFPENDAWWGKGFTEWTNVGKAKPLFLGHHQPHCPIHLGYYDLRVPEVMEEQARLARSYGVSGFAYYFYWFAGKVLMETPLQKMLSNPRVDIPFCMIWANENWTRRWDGQENDVLIAQNHSLDDSKAMLEHLRPYLEDDRYIKIDGKPLFIIYRAAIIPDMAETLEAWRNQAKEFGFPGLYIVCAQTFGHRDPREFGFDAAMEFPPHTILTDDIAHQKEDLDLDFGGNIFDYDLAVSNAVKTPEVEYKVFPTATLSWDNTARKGKQATIFSNFSLKRYSQWLSSNVERVSKDVNLSPDEKITFVNAWNEWAEGTHLEPDQKHGFGYLAATRSVMENYEISGEAYQSPTYPSSANSRFAIISHLHYEEAWDDLVKAISSLTEFAPDVYVTVTSLHLAQIVRRDLPAAVVEIVDNRGRDIRPFLHVFRKIEALGYSSVCKVHGKISAYRNDGGELRRSALQTLLTRQCMERIDVDDSIGLLAPSDAIIEHTDKNMFWDLQQTQSLSEELDITAWRGTFPAGSMFWFKPLALSPLLRIGENRFDVERGLADGTIAHAIERLFASVCVSQGFRVEGV
ncbi:glycoside hydrolase family 99-like domain-containing protein [Agrobacterium sp. DE0009]|uniref:glycoside hydrolase family 99-like domain-containing protein n=1 Tax=Agrobacterium sp. DE0009 TaxID=2587505 RepID=UPI0011AAD10D|nr:glycoside hydrolase family 99-like domain-containing protein [Agrobacterium sp. DE0009]